MSAAELARRFPGYRLPDDLVALYQPDGGILFPERCVAAHARLAAQAGAEIHTQERVTGWSTVADGLAVTTDRGRYTGGALVFTAGAWTGKVLPPLAAHLAPERQVVLWSEPLEPALFRPEAFPVFYMHVPEGAFYGFPAVEGQGFKIGKYHHLRQAVEPDAMDRDARAEDEAVLRDAVEKYFPRAAGRTERMETCLFTNTRDEHFVIDRLPGHEKVVVAAGFSGHGFKFCSVVGDVLADLALRGSTSHDIALFDIGRLAPRSR
jgi:sarcosine oxidase